MNRTFLFDANLSPTLANKLCNNGFDARHVARLGLLRASDKEIWAKAIALNAVIVTKDDDFVTLASQEGNGPSVIHLRVGNMSNMALWQCFEAALPNVLVALDAGQSVVEIRP